MKKCASYPLYLLPILLFSIAYNEVKGQYEALYEKIDMLYYSPNNKDHWKALALCDSIEPIIIKEKGVSSVEYGNFLAFYPAMLYEKLDSFNKAKYYYQKGLSLLNTSTPELIDLYAQTCNNLGNLYRTNGFGYSAINYLQKARELYFKIGELAKEGFAASTLNLANAYSAQDNFYGAEVLYDSSLILIDTLVIQNPVIGTQKFTVYNNRAAMYHIAGDFEKALYWINKAIEIGKTFLVKGSKEYITVINNKTSTLNEAGLPDEAQKTADEFLKEINGKKVFSQNLLNVLKNTLAESYSAKSDYEMAAKELEELLNNRQGILPNLYAGIAFNYVSVCIERRNYKVADSMLQQLLPMVVNDTVGIDAHLKQRIFSIAAKHYLQMGHYTATNDVLNNLYNYITPVINKNISFLPETQKLILLGAVAENNRYNLSALYGSLAKDYKLVNKIFERLLTYRGILLSDKKELLQAEKETKDTALLKIFKEWKQNKMLLAQQFIGSNQSFKGYTDSLIIITENKEMVLRNKIPQLNSFLNDSLSSGMIAAALKKEEAYIQFARFPVYNSKHKSWEFHYGAFLVTPNDSNATWVYLTNETILKKLLLIGPDNKLNKEGLTQILIDERFRKSGQLFNGDRLYQFLIKPLLPYFKNTHQLICITDGLINQIPLHALPAGNKKITADNFTFSYTLSPHGLLNRNINDESNSNPTISLWGNINYNKRKPPVSGSKEEITAIAALASKYKIPNVSNESDTATEAVFTKQETNTPAIIHISTHGYFKPASRLINTPSNKTTAAPFLRNNNPLLYCGLYMAGKADSISNNDGILTGYEIANLNLYGAKLVTLAACETALGATINEEGAFGLHRAFKLAGAEKIIASLYQVPDDKSTELMSKFYELLFTSKNINTSFKEAQQYMRKKYPPYYWAGFVLVE